MKGIDELIRQAIEEGKFDELPGKGQPLAMNTNPYEDPEWRLAYHILDSSGFTLPWLETRRDIEKDLGSARLSLRKAWDWRISEIQRGSNNRIAEEEWQRSIQRFQSQIDHLNKRIAAYNLETPRSQFQIKIVNAAREIQELMTGQNRSSETDGN